MAVTMKRERITPQQARKWLIAMAEHLVNRSLRPSIVKSYAGQIRAGQWHESGETIKLAQKAGIEFPIDGQHRLQAIVQADMPVTMLVVRGLDASAFKYLDQGIPRRLQDYLESAGWANTPRLATTVRLLWRESTSGDPRANPESARRVSEGNLYDWAIANCEDVRILWRDKERLIRAAQRNNMGSAGMLLYLYYRWHHLDDELADHAFKFLADKDTAPHPNFQVAKQAIMAFREKVIRTHGKIPTGLSKTVQDYCLVALNLAWNQTREGVLTSLKPLQARVKQLERADWEPPR